VNFLRITCASRKALPGDGFRPSRRIFFTEHSAVSIVCSAKNFFVDLTIAVLGSVAMETYYPDTLLTLADEKNSTEAAQ
jgi:hypothetical protein